ncbi:hypothetical protein BaRGS_00018941 [Batillaria attramentaria]|uniref:Uncharacterized protein n=1 Tax=Batillaria attramentaria TaxID=370345 RepID=A0ABD0KS91_9CAEN
MSTKNARGSTSVHHHPGPHRGYPTHFQPSLHDLHSQAPSRADKQYFDYMHGHREVYDGPATSQSDLTSDLESERIVRLAADRILKSLSRY